MTLPRNTRVCVGGTSQIAHPFACDDAQPAIYYKGKIDAGTELLLRQTTDVADVLRYRLDRDYTAEAGGQQPELCLMLSSPLLQVGSAYRLINETTGSVLGKVDALESPYSNMKVRTTGIEDVLTDQSADNTFYDLSGRRVAQPAKGIYIKNGKKIVF